VAPPDQITLKRHRDLEGLGHHVWVRRGLLALVLVVPALALANAFGQRPQTTFASTGPASLKVYSPARVRSGLLYTARFHVTAARTLEHAALVLGSGWLENMTVNTIEPAPEKETSDNGSLRLDLGRIEAGKSYLLFIFYQVNPTNVGRREQDVALYDGSTRLLSVDRTITIFP
jgi:hypothetical protein